jgi:hypothetical protein
MGYTVCYMDLFVLAARVQRQRGTVLFVKWGGLGYAQKKYDACPATVPPTAYRKLESNTKAACARTKSKTNGATYNEKNKRCATPHQQSSVSFRRGFPSCLNVSDGSPVKRPYSERKRN